MRVPTPGPLVCAAAAFAAGVALHARLVLPLAWSVLAALLAAVTCAAAWRLGRRRAFLVGAIVLYAALGTTHATLQAPPPPFWVEVADGRTVRAEGIVLEPPEPTLRGWRGVLRVRRLELDAGRLEVDASIRLTGRGPPPHASGGSLVAVRGRFRAGAPAGNPGERSERDALRRRGLVGVLAVGTTPVVVQRPGGGSARGTLAWLRRRIVDAALGALPEPRGALLLSLLLGIDAHLPPELYRQFSAAGMVHLMVVSGAQVGIVAGACAWAMRLARLPPAPAAALSVAAVVAFASLVGWAPSIGRAVVMSAIVLGGVALGRPRDRAATLAAAALALLVAQPAVLFDVGFQLSFAASWGLLFLAPAVAARLAVLGRHAAGALGVTAGAQVAVAPLLAAHFQAVPVAGLLANLLAVPAIAVLVPAGFALIPLVVVAPEAAAPLLRALGPLLDAVLWMGRTFGGLPWATAPSPPVPAWAVAAALGALGAAAAALSGSWRPARVQTFTAAAAAVAVATAWLAGATAPPALLTVTVIDVGQGDAILIRSPSGRVALLDGGGEIGAGRLGWDVGRMRVVPALRRAGVRRLDVVVLSHPHEDHVGGLPAVLENFPVGLVLDPGVPHASVSYARLLRLIEAGRIAHRSARQGLAVDLEAGATLRVLYPPEPAPALGGDPVHARGVVARLAHGAAAMLLAGDAEAPVERYLLDHGVPIASDVLKVGHHGSRTSTTPAFLARVAPRVAVISVGADNPFGHPHEATLAALARAGVTVYRTDRDGAVTLATGGDGWRVTTARTRPHARIH
ncbi:MAG: DNA internalization-related competence protein ComEC/Rec2 [Armatimonadota bacterium]|nr:DNA internalization-related competence protein ComEC/Rec2 [Armatimonadota bacterium]MDR7421954.1 DNA internalization-related competence protein ComEC/Rec2 [Armatimonadota bacterium]MDR7453510.1 DNA internalization-related competence protein ComEC/Rec2 [Armatimonadota bacterium]MDR7456975.1 DNA internalization-related competence protein ComEC/Rec2 [Armatimonadota bacterium]MDR7496498.1 DNA internalization-related competence protein ComEC/Rec2 [Armatimonadota bacterium]